MNVETLSEFLSKVAASHIDGIINQKAIDLYEHRDDIKRKYLDMFKQAFADAQKFTEQTGIEIANISFTLLRYNLLYGKKTYAVHVYDKNWYLNDYVKTGEIDVSDIFGELDKAKEYLISEAKRYVGKFNYSDIDNALSWHFEVFSHFFIKLFRYVLVEITESEQYANIVKDNDFTILTGELYGEPHILYQETKDRTSHKQLLEMIESEERCHYLDLRNSDFVGLSLTNADMSYADFRKGTLNNIDFSNAILLGCIFSDCNLVEANFCDAQLSEADFRNANLQGANLSGVFSAQGVYELIKGEQHYHFPLNLQNADMRNVIFRGAFLHGIDFTNAIIDGATFEETYLRQCKFTRAQLSKVNLTETQRLQVVIV